MSAVAGSIPPLVVGAAPFFARLVENLLREVDRGVFEAFRAIGASTRQTVFWALLPETLPGLVAAITVTAIALIGYSAMSGVIGGGGLGESLDDTHSIDALAQIAPGLGDVTRIRADTG